MACGFKAEGLRGGARRLGARRARDRLHRGGRAARDRRPAAARRRQGLLGERFMVLNGDLLTDLDLTRAPARSTRRPARVTTLGPLSGGGPELVRAGPPREDGEVLGFLEKPDPAEIDTDEVNAGVYVIERDGGRPDPAGRAVSIEREVFPRLVGQGLYGRAPRRLLDGHRHARALPAGELGHPRGRRRDRVDGTGGPYVEAGAARSPRRRGRGPRAVVRAGSRGRRRARSSPRACCSTTAGSAPRPRSGLDSRRRRRGRRRRDDRRRQRDRRGRADRDRRRRRAPARGSRPEK